MSVIKIKDKINNLSAPVRASMAFTVCGVVQKGIGFLTTPIFTRLMSETEYGNYSLYLSWYSIIILLTSLDLTTAYNKALIKFEKDEKRVMSSFLGITTVISLCLLGLFLLNQNYWQKVIGLPSFVILLLLFQCLVEPSYQLWHARERFYYRYKKIMVTTLYIVVGSPTLGIVMVCLSRNKAVARILSNIIIVGILYFFIYIIAFAKGKCFFNKKYWKFGLTMCVPLLPHFLSQTALNQSDRIMISKLVGDDKTAIYSVAYTIAAVISIVITSINNSLLPYMFQNLKNRNYKMKYRINELVVLVGILCFFVMLLGPEFILLVGGERYYDAIWVIPSVTTATYFTFVYSAFSYVELYYEKTIYMSVGSIVACLVNIVLNYIFIPIAGYVVAGYTTLIGFILLATLHYVFYRRCIKEERITDDIIDVRFMLLFSIGMLVLMGVVTISYNYIIVRCLFIAVLIVAAYIHRKKILSLIKKTCRPK